ncbi:MAG: FAD-dependent oxidoreductase [Ktedonobacteraceae bacterium]
MTEQLSYLIIGNGIAGVTAAEILRDENSAADITVIAEDPFPVYYRPALKDYLAGRVHTEKLWARPTSFYQEQNIRFIPGKVTSIQAGQHAVQLQSGQQLGYSRLLLANGARASKLTCPGTELQGVTTLRTVADYQRVLSHLNGIRHIVVSGSGTLALETIETLRHRGYHVIHLLRRRTLWSEVLDATASDLVLQQERRDGVDVHVEEEITEITGKQGQVTGIVTTRGTRIPCEMVIIAIGVEPIIDFIKGSGIPCGRGVKVDGAMRTSAPDIYAAGDVLETTDSATGRTRVIGQWFPAVQQARAAAYSMLDLLDDNRPFRPGIFYNATFLYGLDFASVGLTSIPKSGQGYQELIADPQPRTYRKAILKDGIPVGMIALGNRKGVLAFKRSIDHQVNLSPVASSLYAEHFQLNDWLDKQGVPPTLLGVSRAGDVAMQQVAYTGASLPTIYTFAQPQTSSEAVLVPVAVAALASLSQLQTTRLSQTKIMTIGRQEGVSLRIDHTSVSRRHAEISYANGQYVLHDLGSTNGTFVNEVPIEPGSVHILKESDLLRLGKLVKLTFHMSTAAGQARSTGRKDKVSILGLTMLHEMKTGIYDPAQAPPPLGQPILNADGSLQLPEATSAIPATVVATFDTSPALVIITKGQPAVSLLKKGQRTVIGRDKKAAIVLSDVVASRKHAEVFQGPDGYYIADLGSSNGVIVNQAKIDNPYLLSHGDRVTIGGTQLYFIDVGAKNCQISIPPKVAQPAGSIGSVESMASPPIAPLPQANTTCRHCGAANALHARFCTTCGKSF